MDGVHDMHLLECLMIACMQLMQPYVACLLEKC